MAQALIIYKEILDFYFLSWNISLPVDLKSLRKNVPHYVPKKNADFNAVSEYV